MNKSYTLEEKLQHLKNADKFVRSGKGSQRAYAICAGIPLTTYYQWSRKYSNEAHISQNIRKTSPNQKMVAIGKPQSKYIASGNHVTVEFYESKIDVHSVEQLVTVLKAIKQTATI